MHILAKDREFHREMFHSFSTNAVPGSKSKENSSRGSSTLPGVNATQASLTL